MVADKTHVPFQNHADAATAARTASATTAVARYLVLGTHFKISTTRVS